MPASSKHKYSKTLAFPDTYYELIINVLQSVELFCAYGISKDTYYYWYKKVQTICVEAMEIPDTLSMPEFVSLPVPAEPANVPVESAIRSNAVVTMHIGKAKIDIPETTSTEFIKKIIGALAYVE